MHGGDSYEELLAKLRNDVNGGDSEPVNDLESNIEWLRRLYRLKQLIRAEVYRRNKGIDLDIGSRPHNRNDVTCVITELQNDIRTSNERNYKIIRHLVHKIVSIQERVVNICGELTDVLDVEEEKGVKGNMDALFEEMKQSNEVVLQYLKEGSNKTEAILNPKKKDEKDVLTRSVNSLSQKHSASAGTSRVTEIFYEQEKCSTDKNFVEQSGIDEAKRHRCLIENKKCSVKPNRMSQKPTMKKYSDVELVRKYLKPDRTKKMKINKSKDATRMWCLTPVHEEPLENMAKIT